jgi:RimJ/RimL family protein N-acetyltransferase
MSDRMATLTFPLRTERLELRPFLDADLDALFDMQSDEAMTRYLYWRPRSREEVLIDLERIKQLTATDGEGDAIRLAAVLPDTGAVIGDVSLWRTNRAHAQGEIGYVLHPAHHGHGYATEACEALLRIGFEVFGLHRIFASADARNAPSIRVMERLGMRREAYLRENEFIKGEWTDEVIYALLASEWQPGGHGR